MSRTIYIAGQNRHRDYQRDTLVINEALTYQMNTCQFQLKGIRPNEGDEVIIEDDKLGRLFAGTVVNVSLNRSLPDRSNNVWNIDCDDYRTIADKRLVVETYEDMAADDIFRDLVDKYCPDFTVNGVQIG